MSIIKKIDFDSLFAFVIYGLLIISMGINGMQILMGIGDGAVLSKYLGFYSASAPNSPSYFPVLLGATGVLMLVSALLVIVSVLKKEFVTSSDGIWLKRSLYVGIWATLLYGFMLRVVKNHNGAAELFYYTAFLFLILWFVEARWREFEGKCMINRAKFVPVLLLLLYTFGLPGVLKIIGGSLNMSHYVQIFSGSILDIEPIGVVPFMYIISIMEISVAFLALFALVRGEVSSSRQFNYLKVALLLGAVTFLVLSFGLSVITDYPGATNLVFYSFFMILLYAYTGWQKSEAR